jgi:vancomycin resistance protein YoaR
MLDNKTRDQKFRPTLTFLILCSLPVILCFVNFWTDPFTEVLVSNKASLSQLSAAQKANIALAAKTLDGTVLRPGQTFSFNQTVGPRTSKTGYLQCPSYLEGDTPMTFGGGICLLSSLVYKSALELGLTIRERTAHTRTVHSIPPGFDATVWYGQNDLKFTNNLKVPLTIASRADSQTLEVRLLGRRSRKSDLQDSNHLRRSVIPLSKDKVEVIVLRENGAGLAFISKDFYCVSR